MQGKWDKRADQNQLRPNHRGNDYFDKVLEDAVDFYSPYSRNIALMSMGNHEQSVVDRHSFNILERLSSSIKERTGNKILVGGYWGFVVFIFTDRNGKSHRRVLHYHHGYGGGGEVTRGMIDQSRTRSQYLADIYVSGHIHRRNYDENVMTKLSDNNSLSIVNTNQYFIRSGTYKDEQTGWHASKGRAARPLGGFWLDLTCKSNGQYYFDIEPVPAR